MGKCLQMQKILHLLWSAFLPELFCHDTILPAEGGTARAVWSVVGKAKVMSHLMGDSGGEAYWVFIVILKEKNESVSPPSSILMNESQTPLLPPDSRLLSFRCTWRTYLPVRLFLRQNLSSC